MNVRMVASPGPSGRAGASAPPASFVLGLSGAEAPAAPSPEAEAPADPLLPAPPLPAAGAPAPPPPMTPAVPLARAGAPAAPPPPALPPPQPAASARAGSSAAM